MQPPRFWYSTQGAAPFSETFELTGPAGEAVAHPYEGPRPEGGVEHQLWLVGPLETPLGDELYIWTTEPVPSRLSRWVYLVAPVSPGGSLGATK
jgi:hypothetical protein